MYYFKPMMPFWGRFISASTEWLMSREGRSMIARAIVHCRNRHGREEAIRFHNSLTCVGVIYPQLLPKVD